MNWIKYILTLLLLYFGMGARADNIVTIGTSEGAPGDEVTVSVGLTNTDAVSALQFSIPLGEYLSYVNGSITAGARLASHAASAVEKDGMLNVMVYSTSMAAISGQEGELFTFRLKLGNTPATVTLTPTNLVMTGTTGAQLSGNTSNGSVSIRCAKAQYSTMTVDFGRVPIRSTYTRTVTVTNIGNEPLTITAVTFMDDAFSTTTTLPVEIPAGSSQGIVVSYAPTVRGNVNTQMIVTCNSISKLNTITLQAQPFAVNELHVSDASGTSDEEVTVTLTMNNMDDICAMQANFQLPEQLEYVSGSFELSSRKQDHIANASLHNGVLRLIAFSTTSKAFTGNDGEIGHFKVKLVGRNSTTLKASEAVLTGIINGNTENVISADYGGQITISSPQLYADNTLQFGDVPVTEDVKKTFTIRNYGYAPLTISRIEFDNESFSIEETLPLQINNWQNKTITVVNADKTEGDFATTMHIYSNDPEQRMYSVNVTGCVFAPNYLAFSVEEASANDVSLKVSMDNYDEIMGVQFDINATNGYTINDANIQIDSRAQGMVVSTSQTDNNTLHVFAYMLSGGIAPGNGKLMTMGLTPVQSLANGPYSLTVRNVVMGVQNLTNKYAGTDPINIDFSVPTEKPSDNTQVVVTAGSYTRAYGDANPTFGFASAGADLSGTPEITCLATETSPAGTYPIVITKGSITNNNVSYINGTLTITKAPLTISVGNYSKRQGQANPDFTVNYSGFKNDETETVLNHKPVITTSANTSSTPGEYTIYVSNAEASNYDISYENGILTVTAPQKGDVNSDGKVDTQDAILVIQHYLGAEIPSCFIENVADMNEDGNIDTQDAILIIEKYLNQ